MLQIPLLNHIIFTAQLDTFFSFQEHKKQSTLQTQRTE
jgi:hypothetical protein